MTVGFIEILEISTEKVRFYTVRVEDDALSEFEKFDQNDFTNHQEEFTYLANIIQEIGERGAKAHYFKPEGAAAALPKSPPGIIEANQNHDFGIRLYCIRMNNIVILLNGGIKTTQKAQECPNIKKHFEFACRLATKIDREINSRDIDISDANCFDDYTIEI